MTAAPTVRLESDRAVVEIARRGAQLLSWTVDGVPLIWVPEPRLWPETAPILFPVVGWTRGARVLVAGRSYPLGLHGFARDMSFDVEDEGRDTVRFVLEASPETRALYPFTFRLSVTYRLVGAGLNTTLDIENCGSETMPYACGLHPGFRWPFAGGGRDEYTVAFAGSERADVPVISPDGLFTSARRDIAWDGQELALSDDLFAREALCFLDARSTRLRFRRAGGAAITLVLQGFPHVALWSRPPGRFLSIEAWTGHGDADDSDGDLMTKPSMIMLAPGTSGRHAMTSLYEGAPHPDFFFGDSPGES